LTLPAGVFEKEVSFDINELSFSKIEGYDLVTLENCFSTIEELGAPCLPKASVSILIPQHAKITEVEITYLDTIGIEGNYNIYPTQHPRPFIKGEFFEFVGPNENIYSKSVPYPGKIISTAHTGSMGGFELASLIVYPLQYIPADKKLTFHSNIKFRVSYKNKLRSLETKTEKQNKIFKERVKNLVINPEDISVFQPSTKLRGWNAVDSAEYVIITADSFKTAFQQLADWKTKKGVPAKVVTVDSIYSEYTGRDNAEKVRNFIINANSSWGAIWILLGGQCDYEWGHEIVPRRNVWYRSTNLGNYPDEDTIPSDLYFSDLDGDWNADGDDIYGESSDEVDLYSDVFVGRAPVRTVVQAETFVEKVLTYEKDPPPGYQKKILLPAAYLWPSIYDETATQEAIADMIPGDWQVSRMYEREGDLTQEAFVDSVRSGFGFTHLMGHGNEHGIYIYYADAYFNSDDLDALDNDSLLGIHNSMACMCGGLDLVPYGDCFAEHYLTPASGGSYSIMNSRYGWGSPPLIGPSEHIDTCFYHEIFRENYTYHDHLGVAHAFSKDGYVSEASWRSFWAWCIYELNLFGDPEMPLWTDIPTELTVTHEAVLSIGTNTSSVNVTDEGFGVENAYVCLYKENEVYARGHTDAFGDIILELSTLPASPGTMYCTVTKNNYLPHESTINIISPTSPWVIFKGYSLIDVSGTDNNVDPGDSIALTLSVHNVGFVDASNVTGIIRTNDMYVDITDSLENFGNILADSISISPETFDFNVLTECPANHDINFELITRDQNDSTWISSFVIPVYTPDISLSADTLDFDTVYLGYPDTIELQVNNLGRDTLVVSDIVSDNTDYSVDNTDFEVLPLETHAVKVIFDPAIDGLSTGNLTINNNDIDESILTVFLQGEGSEPPDISVSPYSLDDSLYTGEMSTDTLSIYNTGGSNLIFDISFEELFPATKSQNINFKITEYKNNKKTVQEKNSENAVIFEEEFSKRIYESVTPTSELQNILVMERGPGSYYYNLALENLGLPRTLVTSWDELHTELISGTQWELIIVNSYGNRPSEEILDLLDDYQSNGGLLIYTDWAIYEYPSHSLLTSLGISFVSDFTVPVNFYAIDPGHTLFNQPNDIDSLHWTDNQYNIDGEIVDVLPGATQLAYLEGYPNSGAIVLNEKSNCLFNAFQSMNFNADDDGDGKNDILELIENEIRFLATQWLSVNPISGVIPFNDSVLIEVVFDANNLYGGNYFADITVASNDPDESELVVPAHLHVTGIPDISVSTETLDFGIVFNGHSASKTLSISNAGTDLLTVNDISSDNPDFTANITNFTLDPKKTQAVTITLTPNSPGTISGKLTIYCDDPDEPTKEIILQGRCLEPPDISVSPESLNDSLVTGEFSIHKLTVYNTGSSDLILGVSERIVDPFPPSVSLSRNQSKQRTEKKTNSLSKTSVDGKIATGNFSGSTSRSYDSPTASGTANIAILGSESPGDEYLSNIAGYLINSGRFASVTTINAYEYIPTIAELQIYDVVGVFGWDYWYNADAIGNLLADYIDLGGNAFLAFAANGTGGGWQVKGRFDTENYWLILPYDYVGGTSYYMGNVYEEDHPIMAGVNSVISRSKLSNGAFVNPEATLLAEFLDGTPLVAVNDRGNIRRVDISFPFFTSAASDWGVDTTSDVRLLIINAFEWLSTPKWLSTDPTSDTIQAGDSSIIEVTFDANDFYGGDYFADIIVSSNDPDKPELVVPAHLHVTGAPDIDVSEDTLNFGIVFTGFSVTDTLIISNNGTDTLTINNIRTDYYHYIIDTTNFTINPGESQAVSIIFKPIAPGTFLRVLRIDCDDPDEPVVKLFLRGECREPPDISISTDSLSDTLYLDQISTHLLTIYNTGLSNLDFDILINETNIFSKESKINKKPSGNSQTSDVSQSLKPEEAADGIPQNFTASTPREFASSKILGDDFEDGDYNGWSDCGSYGIKEVTNTTAANKSDYSYHEYESPPTSHYDGIYQELGAAQPGYISFYIRSGSNTTHDAYFVLTSSSGDDAIFFFARGSGNFYVNGNAGGDETYSYAALTWYHIEFKNIDFTSKTFDYYVNEVLIKTDIPFRDASIIQNFDRLDLYNFTEGSQAWWDEILIATEEPPIWITVDTAGGTVPAGDSTQIEVRFNAAGMDVGNYYADIIIENNDPGNSEVKISAHMQVAAGSGIEEAKTPKVFFVKQNYPNPFNQQTVIRYGCPEESKVCIQVFDCLGRIVITLVNKKIKAGYHEVTWDGTNKSGKKVANAVYFYRMQTDKDFKETRKMILLK
jgi:hypothetical protein